MALIQCPECGGNVSDLAPACPHCGRHLVDAELDQARYAVVMLNGGPFHDETAECLSRIDALTRSEALDAIKSAPVILVRNMGRKDTVQYVSTLSKYCEVKVVRDEYAKTVEAALGAEACILPPRHSQPRLSLTFGETMLAAFLGCALWGIFSSIFFSIIT